MTVAAPIGGLVFLLGLWELAARTGALSDVLGLEPFLVPSPSEIADSLWTDRELLADNGWTTFVEVIAGFAVAVILGVCFAAVLHLSPFMRRAFYPLVVASQTIPVIVIAPIFVIWFDFGIGPKIALITLICFFPITVNTLDGLRTVDPDQRKMMRTLGASRWQIFSRLELPSSLPHLISGAKIAVAVAVIGAVFAEWSGSSEGLGRQIQIDNAQLNTPRLFAAMAVLSAMAMALFGLLTLLERRFAWWGRETQGSGASGSFMDQMTRKEPTS